jgi:hypothetical protein
MAAEGQQQSKPISEIFLALFVMTLVLILIMEINWKERGKKTYIKSYEYLFSDFLDIFQNQSIILLQEQLFAMRGI